MTHRILVVEDDPDLALGLRNNLEIEGYDAAVSTDGKAALDRAMRWRPDLIVLDLTLPKLDGMHVLRRLKERDARLSVLVLTARGSEMDKVRGLKLGADDYVTKPFGLLEFLARVESILRRRTLAEQSGASASPIRYGNVEINIQARTVSRTGVAVALRPKEFELLVQLATHQGIVLSRLDLMKRVWGYSSSIMTRTVDTHMWELRRKLETVPSRPRHIVTVRGSGYRLDP